ncbi:secretion-regulating guanine nucleotide exchange factor isoform X2 [Lampris incognitus]|uniref:secretion-regulating guanine nucleotide exchange factor isoform X2 n=1 Tax=Lampris incognitus TaxID=2546036 RepID=UPI0024B606C7|nr:secretion-regulating guanine nucleotide exchange factor isoform X2 [Lampris incognitus]
MELCVSSAEAGATLWSSPGEEMCWFADRTSEGSWGLATLRTSQPFKSALNRVGPLSVCPVVGISLFFSLVNISDSGQVLACGSNAFGQLGVAQPVTHSAHHLLVESLKEPVVSVAAGLRHSLAVTNSGCVYQWGTGLYSQAKRALFPHAVPAHLSSKLPSLVPGLDQVTPLTVAAGSTHCVCLTEGGDLFLWGSNKHGQLTTTEPFLSSPTPLKHTLLDRERVTHVWSGWTHLVAKTESGRVFTWGRRDYGQLGRMEPSCQNTEQKSGGPLAKCGSQGACLPAEVKVLHGAEQIACGSEHNLAIVGGCLFSWGWNEHGMCGDGSQTDVVQPKLMFGLRPLLIGCGAGHSMALCAAETGSGQNSAGGTPGTSAQKCTHLLNM